MREVSGRLAVALTLLAIGVAALATHRVGIPWGDDFSLYLRQARSLFDGNVGQVIADNHDNVRLAARPGFSPDVYPWGYPMLLAPVVRAVGIESELLKVVGVAAWLVALLALWHLARRRFTPPAVPLLLVAVVGTSLPHLRHTAQLLSELPYLAIVFVTLAWLDHCRRAGPLDRASTRQLAVLGLLAAAAFNVRREGAAMLVAIIASQVVDGLRRDRRLGSNERPDGVGVPTARPNECDQRRAALPAATWFGAVVAFQMLLPSALAPHYDGAGLRVTWEKLGEPFRSAFRDQLGFGAIPGWLGWSIFTLMVVGVLYRLAAAPGDDIAVVVFPVVSTVVVGMHPAAGARYLLPITPFAVYFAAQGLVAIAHGLQGLVGVTQGRAAAAQGRRGAGRSGAGRSGAGRSGAGRSGAAERRIAGGKLVIAGLSVALAVHVVQLPGEWRATRRANALGVVDGPQQADAREAFAAVTALTRLDDIIAVCKARALTLYTDRRGVQSSELDVVLQRAEYYLMRRGLERDQPLLSDGEAAKLGLVEVWSNDGWVLWQIPPAARAASLTEREPSAANDPTIAS